jgi:hypothetical protein
MRHTKRRIKDTLEIFNDGFKLINWKNALVTIPGMLLIMPIICFGMLFEDYDEIDNANLWMNGELKNNIR